MGEEKPTVTLADAQAMKAKAEEGIAEILNSLCGFSGLYVEAVELHTVRSIANPSGHVVSVNIRVTLPNGPKD